MNRFENISNTDLTRIINDWVKNERDRRVLHRKLIDGISYERIAEEFSLSVKQIYRIIGKYTDMLFKLCNDWTVICP